MAKGEKSPMGQEGEEMTHSMGEGTETGGDVSPENPMAEMGSGENESLQ
jgi:hypothetical protein